MNTALVTTQVNTLGHWQNSLSDIIFENPTNLETADTRTGILASSQVPYIMTVFRGRVILLSETYVGQT